MSQQIGQLERKLVSYEWFVSILKKVFHEDGFGIDAYFDVREFSNATVSQYSHLPFHLALANLIWVDKLSIRVWSTQDPRMQQGFISFTTLGNGLNTLAKQHPKEFKDLVDYKEGAFITQEEIGLFLTYVIQSK